MGSAQAATSAPRTGVIWITGFSGAGKTAVAREVERRLRDDGQPVLRLDGDDLRSILAARWGYEREERVDLARVYFRLSSHLASQGFIVIIAAVAMYEDVRAWVRQNIPNSLEVYLDVPFEVRRQRDAGKKNVYAAGVDLQDLYEPPTDTAMRIENYGDVTAGDAGRMVRDAFVFQGTRPEPDRGKTEHWQRYYAAGVGTLTPSPFAVDAASVVDPASDVLEVGCGNGRDAAYLAGLGHNVTAVDPSEAAIQLCRKLHDSPNARFLTGTVGSLSADWTSSFDVVYSRFVIHAMTEAEEIELLNDVARLLRTGGVLMVECRSINDPLARKGDVLSPTERIEGHYRRFIVLEDFLRRLIAAGLTVEDAIEADGLAKHGDDDPVVIRVTARRG